MAGAFGYESGDHYDVSLKCGERVLLPEVRQAADDALIITDGFSCREQIRQQTHREALHLAQVLKLAKDGLRHDERPEAPLLERRRREHRDANVRAALIAAGLLAAGIAIWRSQRAAREKAGCPMRAPRDARYRARTRSGVTHEIARARPRR
jgi:hypothetical protein